MNTLKILNVPFIFTNTSFIFTNTPIIFTNTSFIYTNTPFIFTNTPFIFTNTSFIFTNTSFIFTHTIHSLFLCKLFLKCLTNSHSFRMHSLISRTLPLRLPEAIESLTSELQGQLFQILTRSTHQLLDTAKYPQENSFFLFEFLKFFSNLFLFCYLVKAYTR